MCLLETLVLSSVLFCFWCLLQTHFFLTQSDTVSLSYPSESFIVIADVLFYTFYSNVSFLESLSPLPPSSGSIWVFCFHLSFPPPLIGFFHCNTIDLWVWSLCCEGLYCVSRVFSSIPSFQWHLAPQSCQPELSPDGAWCLLGLRTTALWTWKFYREVDDRFPNVRTFRKVGPCSVQSVKAEPDHKGVEDCLFSADVRPLLGVALEYVLTAGGEGSRDKQSG